MNQLIESGRLVWRLLQDNRVPAWVKAGIPVIVALYLLFPIDFLPDFIPVLGQLDDIGVILLGMSLIVRFSPTNVVEEHRRALGIQMDYASGATSRTTRDRTQRDYGEPTRRVTPNGSGTIEGEYKVVDEDRK
jgi:uncharacterized membrane protein YkvA (DUF1232 family)